MWTAERSPFALARVDLPPLGGTPFDVVAADMDGDGRRDLLVSDADGGTVTLLRGSADGRWTPGWRATAVPVARGMTVADLDGDGSLDLAVASGKASQIAVFLLRGSPPRDPIMVDAGMAPFDIAAADLDGDGAVDLAVANETNAGDRRGDVTVLYGDGRGGVSRRSTLEAGRYPAKVEIADLDRDDRPDLAVLNWGSGDLVLLHGQSDGSFAAPIPVVHGGGPAYGLAAADLDRDGVPELVVAEATGSLRLLRREPGGTYTLAQVLEVGAGARDVVAADLDGDGWLDLATADTGDDGVSLLRGLGGGRFAPRQRVAVGHLPRRLTAADLDADGRLDLAVTAGGAGSVSLLLARASAR